jgi:outer membrane immunogenic protein
MGRFYRGRLKSSTALLAASAAFLATSAILAPAQAADMGVPARSYYPPLPPAIYDWTGIYLGFHVGGGILTDSVSQNGTSVNGFNLVSSGNLRPAGVIGGLQGGANYEFAPWVVGIEGSWTDSAIQGNTLIGCSGCAVAVGKPPALIGISQERFTSQAQWFAAVTGRFGYAANLLVFFVLFNFFYLWITFAPAKATDDPTRTVTLIMRTSIGPRSIIASFTSSKRTTKASSVGDESRFAGRPLTSVVPTRSD